MSEEIVLRTITNWQSELVCVHLSYSNSLVSKIFLFAWEWQYRPMNCLTDKVRLRGVAVLQGNQIVLHGIIKAIEWGQRKFITKRKALIIQTMNQTQE